MPGPLGLHHVYAYADMFYFFGGDMPPCPAAPVTSKPDKASPALQQAPAPESALGDGAPSSSRQPKATGKRGAKGRAAPPVAVEEVMAVEVEMEVKEEGGAQGKEGGMADVKKEEKGEGEGARGAEGGDASASSQGTEPVVVRIHFGMSGAFKVSTSLPGPVPTPTTRLSLTNR